MGDFDGKVVLVTGGAWHWGVSDATDCGADDRRDGNVHDPGARRNPRVVLSMAAREDGIERDLSLD